MSTCKHERDWTREMIKQEPEAKRATYWYPCKHCDKSIVAVFEGGKCHVEPWKDNKRIARKAAHILHNHRMTEQVMALATMPKPDDLKFDSQSELF